MPDTDQSEGRNKVTGSPKSVKATMLRVLVVLPVLLVTQISTRLICTPVIRLGNFDMPSA